MRHLFVCSLMLFFAIAISAQEKSVTDLNNEAKVAIAAKDFQKALPLLEEAMQKQAGQEADAAMIFNAAHCARQLEQYEKAIKYYSEAEKLNYKADMACFYVASSYKKLDKDSEVEKTLVEGIQKYSDSKVLPNMKKMLVDYYLVEGSKSFNEANQILGSSTPANQEELDALVAKANVKFAEAKPWFEKALVYAPDDERVIKPLTDIKQRLEKK